MHDISKQAHRLSRVRTIEQDDRSSYLHTTVHTCGDLPIIICCTQDGTRQWCSCPVSCTNLAWDSAQKNSWGSLMCRRRIRLYSPGTLNSRSKPDNPANLSAPYKCAATAGVKERKLPQKNPYRIANPIWDKMINIAYTCNARKMVNQESLDALYQHNYWWKPKLTVDWAPTLLLQRRAHWLVPCDLR